MNKYAMTLLIVVGITGCEASKPPLGIRAEKQVEVSFYDFRDFAAKGFLFSPFVYEGQFEALGGVFVKITPETTAGNAYYNDASGNQKQRTIYFPRQHNIGCVNQSDCPTSSS